ncbi:helix-turn-helix domain-containing protein [Cohnella rhizosphaerae]|uniref:TetR/AcrR family transcriptional regulator n=1 Tax=Cohnella rhizosphaerae TaxID=1457232 RepID=A0A9X4KSE2_9BACL|nr:helix-turn-helix domain-containing protein [Cohnella rhizosphaerae]MDG0809838.1 TetR/AcrR family transcriptional regulator [Cohnella rhizosphaerae]
MNDRVEEELLQVASLCCAATNKIAVRHLDEFRIDTAYLFVANNSKLNYIPSGIYINESEQEERPVCKKNKFQLKREATYRLLVEAGWHCFAEKGYASTTLSDIVARTGHTKGAFYGHFQSKEQLFMHVLDFQIERTDGWWDIPRDYSPSDFTLEEVIGFTLVRLGELMMGIDNWIVTLVDFYQQTKRDEAMQQQA